MTERQMWLGTQRAKEGDRQGRRGSVDHQEPVESSKGLPVLSIGIGAMQGIEERTVRV